MTTLAQKRCRIHADREAAARCPACGRFFCRECVTEHEGRVLCARCLAEKAGTGKKSSRAGFFSAVATNLFFPLLGYLTAWMVFFYLGKILLAIPSTFHEGTFLTPP